MDLVNFRVEQSRDAIAVVTWDMPDRSMNVITVAVMDELEAVIDRVAGDAATAGAVIVSGKDAFSGGADISILAGIAAEFGAMRARDPIGAKRTLLEQSSRLSRIYRRLETCGKPFVV